MSEEYGKSPGQVLVRWNLQIGTGPLPKARGRHLEENIGVFDFELRPGEIDRLTGLNENWSALGASLQYA